MKQKKRIVMVLALMWLGICTACGKNGEESVADSEPAVEISEEQEKDEAENKTEDTEKEEVKEENDTESDALDIEKEEVESKDNEEELSLGIVQDGVYTNDYLGVGCKFDSSWETQYGEALNGFTEESLKLFEGTEIEEIAAQTVQIADLVADCTKEMTSVNVILQKTTTDQLLAFSQLGEEGNIDSMIDVTGDLMIEQYGKAGIDVEKMYKKSMEFLGEEHYGLMIEAKIQGIDYYCFQIMLFDAKPYYAIYTFASLEEDKTEGLPGMFYKLDE